MSTGPAVWYYTILVRPIAILTLYVGFGIDPTSADGISSCK